MLQQVEHFESPSTTVNDAFRAVTRYWDRITRPAQLLTSLPQAVATMLDPADCGPAFLGLPQDVQAEAYDFPVAFFERVPTRFIPRPRPSLSHLEMASDLLTDATRPLIIAGGGVHYSGAELELQRVRRDARHPGRRDDGGQGLADVGRPGAGRPDRRHRLRPRRTGSRPTADVVLCVGTRLQDFTTGSWTVFGADTQLIGLNAARFDAVKHRSLPLQGDARDTLRELTAKLGECRAPAEWGARAAEEAARLPRVRRRPHRPDRGRHHLRAGGRRRQPPRDARRTTWWPPRAASRAS